MRHAKQNKRFGRSRSARKELIRSLARNAIIYTRIKTTLSKAKEASKLVERLISIGKQQTLQARRAAFDILRDKTLVSRLMNDIAPLFKDRNGGYTRIIQLDNRPGDGTKMALLELVEKVKKEPAAKKVKTTKPKDAVPAPEAKKEAPKKAKEVKVKQEKPKKPAPEKEIKPKEKVIPAEKKEKESPKPEKKGLFGRIKGIFKKD